MTSRTSLIAPTPAARTALVTGASRGVGRAIAQALVDAGLSVAVHARALDHLDDAMLTMVGRPGTAAPFAADMSDPVQVHDLLDEVTAHFGAVDLLVNNAGIIDEIEVPLWAADPAQWWHVVEVNLRGPMLASHAVLPQMLARGQGRIINVNTLSASRSDPAYSAYSAAKAGLARMTDSLATALAGRGVFVWDVSPGLVHTAMTDGMPMWSETPSERWTPPERMAKLVVRLARGDGDAVSGRFLRSSDDLDGLIGTLGRSQDPDARKLRIQPYSATDDLARHAQR